jgi:hypothetical protein
MAHRIASFLLCIYLRALAAVASEPVVDEPSPASVAEGSVCSCSSTGDIRCTEQNQGTMSVESSDSDDDEADPVTSVMPPEANQLRAAVVPVSSAVPRGCDGASTVTETGHAAPRRPCNSAACGSYMGEMRVPSTPVCCCVGLRHVDPGDRDAVRSVDFCSLRAAVRSVPTTPLVFHGPLPRFTTSTTALRLPDGPPPSTPSRAQEVLQLRTRHASQPPAEEVRYGAMLSSSQRRPAPYA